MKPGGSTPTLEIGRRRSSSLRFFVRSLRVDSMRIGIFLSCIHLHPYGGSFVHVLFEGIRT